MSPWKKIGLSLFILFHLGACVVWVLPDSYIRTSTHPVLAPYVLGMGVWQWWGMFSPDPTNQTLYIYGRAVHSDGSTWMYWMPQLNKMGQVERYGDYRFRVFVETAHLDYSETFWPDLARWIAAKDHEATGKQPVRVLLYRTWWLVPPPPTDTSKPPVPEWHVYRFFELKIPAKPGRKLPVKYMPKTIIATR